MGRRVGIDLGTTNSVISIVAVEKKAKILYNAEGKPEMPSVVGPIMTKHKKNSDKDESYIGELALDNWENAPDDTIYSVKRLMGRSFTDPKVEEVRKKVLYRIVEPADGTKDNVRVVMSGKLYSPVEISAKILNKLKKDAEHWLGEEVTHAVVTVPAYFSQIQREATWRAANLAGLKVLRILSEPTAAAIAFGLDSESSEEPKKILVYDLGGGTFDISLLMWGGSNFVQLNTEGDMWLGGDDFDQVIVDKAVEYISIEYGIDARQNKSFMAALKKKARAAKERLSAASSTKFIVTGLRGEKGDLIDVDMEITRQEFEQMIRSKVDDTIKLTQKTLAEVQLTVDDIDCIVMAGNSTYIPLVQRSVESMFGKKKVLYNVQPKHSVAMGAAILAASLNRVICRNCETANDIEAVNCSNPECGKPLQFDNKTEEPERQIYIDDDSITIAEGAHFPYGIQSAGDQFNIFVRKNDPYPTPEENKKTLPFATRTANQRMIKIPVYGGEKLEKASANEKQGEAFAVLPAGLPRGTVVRIKLWLNDSEIFKISAHLEDGTALKPWIILPGLEHKAVEEFDRLLEELNKWEKNATQEQSEKIDKTVVEAYELLEGRKIDDAIRLVKKVLEELNKQGSGEGGQTVWITFAEFILHEYNWALNPQQAYNLSKLVEEAKKALSEGSPNAEQKLGQLRDSINNMPDVIHALLWLKDEIPRLQTENPVLAKELMGEVQEVEGMLKRDPRSGQKLLLQLCEKVKDATDGLGKIKCPACKKEYESNKKKCPYCGDDRELLERFRGGLSGSSGSFGTRSQI